MGFYFVENTFFALPLNIFNALRELLSLLKHRIIFIAVLVLHVLVIFGLSRWMFDTAQSVAIPADKVKWLYEDSVTQVDISEPNISVSQRSFSIVPPRIDYDEQHSVVSTVINPDAQNPVYALPEESHHNTVFDPKLRKKLDEAEPFNRPRAAEKSTSYTTADGRTFVEMGDGNCLVTMQKMDARERGTALGYISCGKTDSEKSVDRIMADFQNRNLKHD